MSLKLRFLMIENICELNEMYESKFGRNRFLLWNFKLSTIEQLILIIVAILVTKVNR